MIEPSGSRFVAVLGNLAIGVCRTWLLGKVGRMKCKLPMHVYVDVAGDESINVEVSSKYVLMEFF